MYCDGPYIFEDGSSFKAVWIDDNKRKSADLHNIEPGRINPHINRAFNPTDVRSQEFQTYSSYAIDSPAPIVAVSDVHGHFDTFISLLQAHKILDQSYKWIFGTGHLVIVGDIFDRGDQVLECLWLVHNLQAEAAKVGGGVHFLVGNHDWMVLSGDLRFLKEKYWLSAGLLDTQYDALFSRQSYLGQWLRTCPVVLKINQYLFVHGGTSTQLLDLNLSIQEINERFRDQIFQPVVCSREDHKINQILLGAMGPLWHRGFFDGSMGQDQVNKARGYFDVEYIVVGHTPQSQINFRFNRCVIAIDAGFKTGAEGELLWIDTDGPVRGISNGNTVKIN